MHLNLISEAVLSLSNLCGARSKIASAKVLAKNGKCVVCNDSIPRIRLEKLYSFNPTSKKPFVILYYRGWNLPTS